VRSVGILPRRLRRHSSSDRDEMLRFTGRTFRPATPQPPRPDSIISTNITVSLIPVLCSLLDSQASQNAQNNWLASFYSASAYLAMHSAVLAIVNQSVRPSVRPSHAGESKRLKLRSWVLYCRIAP